MEPPLDGGTKVYSNEPGHMTKMATIPIYGMQHRVHKYYQVCSNYDSGLILTYFTARSNLLLYAFVWENGKSKDFSETIVVRDIKIGRCS